MAERTLCYEIFWATEDVRAIAIVSCFFPTCQVRVVILSELFSSSASCPPRPLPPPPSPPPPLPPPPVSPRPCLHQLPPQLPPCQLFAKLFANFPAQCAPLDLNGQIECQKRCQIECQIECQKICQIKCHEICQIECQKICQIEC